MKRYPLAALACAALVAGCGGGDTASKPLSKSAFIERADQICRDSNERAAKVKQPTGPAGLSRFVDETKPIIEDQRDDLRGLESRAPEAVSADFSKTIDVLGQLITKFSEFKEVGTDRTKIVAIGEDLERLQTRHDALVDKIGLKECDN